MPKQVFICHASEDHLVAEEIATALRTRGFKVFLDKDSLEAGDGHDARITAALNKSSVFVFLISPSSVAPNCYTLTELRLAQKKEPNPSKWVLPVIVTEVDQKLPPYLQTVAPLRTQGHLPAEVGNAVARMTKSSGKMVALAAVVLVLGLGIAVFAMTRQTTPTYNPSSYQPTTYTPYYRATARCTRTGVVGTGTGSTERDARVVAIEDCIDRGGIEGCCQVIDVREE